MTKDDKAAQPRAWFTIGEINEWAARKLGENPEWNRAARDLVTTGMAVMQGDRRIDPASVYKDEGASCYCPNCEALAKELAALKAAQQGMWVGTDGPTLTAGGHPLAKAFNDGVLEGALRERAQWEQAQQRKPDYSWPTIANYEKDVGFEVNDAFKAGWDMARTTDTMLGIKGSEE